MTEEFVSFILFTA